MNYRLYKKKGIITDLFDEFTAKVKVEKYTVKIDQVRMNGMIDDYRMSYKQQFLKKEKLVQLLMDH